MTLELSAPTRFTAAGFTAARFTEIESGATLRWMTPAAGLWVAHRRGDYAGMVERIDGTYRVRNARGRDLGAFTDLDSARAAIDHSPAAGRTPRFGWLTGILIGINAGAVVGAAGLAYLLVR